MGGFLMFLAFAVGTVAYVGTVIGAFAINGFVGFAALAIPPADLVISWVVHPYLGIASIASIGLFMAAGSVKESVDA